MGVKGNNLKKKAVRKKPAIKRRKRDTQYESILQKSKEKNEERRRKDELFRIIYPSANDVLSGAYKSRLNWYCTTLYRMYTHIYGTQYGMPLPKAAKEIMERIISCDDLPLKNAFIFYSLVKELTFFYYFVPETELVYDSSSGTMVAKPKSEPKVNVAKMQYFIERWAVPYTMQLLNGNSDMGPYDYVRKLRVRWLIAPELTYC